MSWWLLTFCREYPARYLSHLDTVRALQRTFARARVPIALSEGMRPKPRISLPLPLPVGAAGLEEVALLKVAEGAPGSLEALRALREAAPPGLRPLEIALLGEQRPHPQPLEAEYVCELDGPFAAILAALERYRATDVVEVERVSPKGRRCIDLKQFLVCADAVETEEGAHLRFTLRYDERGSARPQEFLDLIAGWAEVEPVMRGLVRHRITWKGVPARLVAANGRSVR